MSQPLKPLAPAFIRTIELDYFPPLVNPLSVNAGPDQLISPELTGTLTGSVSSDGAGDIETEWTLVSGPGSVVISEPTELATGIEVSEHGVYIFKLTATQGEWSGFDEVSIVFSNVLPQVDLQCMSESGVATLCGFSEFNGQESTPPRKYLRLSNSGNTTLCYRTGLSCVTPITTIDSYSFDVADVVYDPVTCTSNSVPLFHWVKASAICAFHQDGGALPNGFVAQRSNLVEDGSTITITPTTYTRTGLGTCIIAAPNYLTSNGTIQQVLSDEDTELDAMARASTTPGTSCTAAIEPRGAGDFSFNFVAVAYDINCANLVPGFNYMATVDLVEETYGGGSPVVTTQEYPFLAASATHVISDAIVCPHGKQVTVQNVTISIVL